MTLLERLRTTPTPAVLYHYTTQSGLLGILRDNCLWASAALYLNDSSEYFCGLSLIEEGVRAECKQASIEQEAANLSR